MREEEVVEGLHHGSSLGESCQSVLEMAVVKTGQG